MMDNQTKHKILYQCCQMENCMYKTIWVLLQSVKPSCCYKAFGDVNSNGSQQRVTSYKRCVDLEKSYSHIV